MTKHTRCRCRIRATQSDYELPFLPLDLRDRLRARYNKVLVVSRSKRARTKNVYNNIVCTFSGQYPARCGSFKLTGSNLVLEVLPNVWKRIDSTFGGNVSAAL